jgi:dTDP-4-dehydrorhamnose reductase
MKHLVLGSGNLGTDLFETIVKAGHEAVIWKHGDKFDWPNTPPRGLDAFTHIWCAVGYGSVNEAAAKFRHAVDVHVNLPDYIVRHAPQARLIFFSTDYIESPASSLYALTKYFMEHRLAFEMNWGGRRNINIIRLGSLYGKHRQVKNLAYRLQQNLDEILKLPSNMIRPTPTKWVAEVLVDKINDIPPLFHLCPSDDVSVADFGKFCTGKEVEVGMIDIQRPRVIEPKCAYLKDAPTWKSLYEEYAL